MAERTFQWTYDRSPVEGRERVDHFVARASGESRERVKESLTQGLLLVNGRPVKPSYRLRRGDTLLFTPPPPPLTAAHPEQLPVEVVYRDDHLLVVNKAAGMVVHPAPGHSSGTLVNALLGLGVFSSELGEIRPGIVHRIDKGTSGLLVVSRTPKAREGLVAQFKEHSIHRKYIALVQGIPSPRQGTYTTLHGRNPHNRLKFSSLVATGKEAITNYRVEETFSTLAALVHVTLSTGRTHQVRVHFADHRHPLIGDPLYNRRGGPAALNPLGKALGRQALHAAELGFVHPITGEELLFCAPLPEELERLYLALKEL